MKYFVANEEQYKAQLRNFYNSLLNGRLLGFDIEKLSNEEIMGSITDYNCSESVANNNFCTWVYIGDIIPSEYNGINYEYVTFLSGEKVVFKINLSQFKYAMSSFDQTFDTFSHYDSRIAKNICTIDGQTISPKLYFQKYKGTRLLLIYSFLAATALGTEKHCYQFAHDEIAPTDIKAYMKYAQYRTLLDVLKSPTNNIPYTTIKIVTENRPDEPYYTPNTRCKESDDFALELFNREFRSSFDNLLSRYKGSIIQP